MTRLFLHLIHLSLHFVLHVLVVVVVVGAKCSSFLILVQVVHEILGHSLSQLPQAPPHSTVGEKERKMLLKEGSPFCMHAFTKH